MSRRWFIVIGALILIAVIGALVWTQLVQPSQVTPQFTADDIAEAHIGTLTATVSATGSIDPATEAQLAFLTSGNVAEVPVKRGDKVHAGQALATLEHIEADLQVAQAQAQLDAAIAAYQKLKQGPSASALALAQANLESAQLAYAAVKNPSASSVASAQSAYASAVAQYNALLKPDATQLAIAKADVDKAKAALTQAQAAYDRIGGASNPFSAQTPQALQLQNATLDYQKALDAFNARFQPTDAQLKQAQAQVQQSKDALDRLQPTADNLARAQAQIQQAQDALARLNPDAQDLAQTQANVAAAQAARDLAQERAKQAILTAPVDGTVTSLDLARGEFVQAGRPVVTLADLDHLQITLNIDETDIPRVALNQNVVLDFDAFPDKEIKGTVREIAPAASNVSGVVNYQVLIDLAPGDVPIKPGMTANANIEVARKDNVLLIPTRAIRAQGSKRIVTILENGQPKDVVITLGLANDQETEVTNGLSAGAEVLTIAVPSNQPGFRGFGNSATATPQSQ